MQTLMDRMGEQMRLRGFALKTQPSYRGAVMGLATHFARLPDTRDALTEAELRAFFLDLVTTRQVSRSTLIVYRSGIRFLYDVTLHRTWPVSDLVRSAQRHVLPVVLSTDEVRQVLAQVPRSAGAHGAHHDLLVRTAARRRRHAGDARHRQCAHVCARPRRERRTGSVCAAPAAQDVLPFVGKVEGIADKLQPCRDHC